MRLLKVIGVLAIAISLTGLVYAETQSVKISGDLAVRSIMRMDYDLDRNHAEELDYTEATGSFAGTTNPNTRHGNSSDWDTHFMTTTEVQIDADLTDNINAVIRLFNQRDWNVNTKAVSVQTPFVVDTAATAYTANADEFAIGVDLAYVELKEFLYSPLTLKIGRQDIWFGKGFIVGANLQDPTASITADEYTCVWSFDSVRATLDYDPWTIDTIAAKIEENDVQSNDDIDLYGVNVGYIFDVYNAEAEGYWFYKQDKSVESWNVKDANTVHTLGLRGSLDPIEDWTVCAEGAVQYGKYVGSRYQRESRDRQAYALDVSVETRHFQEQYAWKPTLGLEYILYSGDDAQDEETLISSSIYTGWDSMYRGKFDSAIREFMGSFYYTSMDRNNARTRMNPAIIDKSNTNQHQVVVIGSVQPTDSLTVDARYINFWQQYATYYINPDPDGTEPTRVKSDEYIGAEIDVELTWDYTEDVQFGLLTAWFFPGSHYFDSSDDTATDIVASMKLSF